MKVIAKQKIVLNILFNLHFRGILVSLIILFSQFYKNLYLTYLCSFSTLK